MALPKLKEWSLGTILDAFIRKDGSVAMTDALTLAGAPTDTLHAATKGYVDSASGAIFVGFSAYKGSDQTGIATVTATKVTFTTEEYDVGSYYDAANSKFTPPSGKYLIMAGYYFSAGVADQGYLRIYLYKNGAIYKAVDQQASGAAAQGISIAAIVDADGDDYFEIYAYGATSTTLTILGSQTLTWFQACKV